MFELDYNASLSIQQAEFAKMMMLEEESFIKAQNEAAKEAVTEPIKKAKKYVIKLKKRVVVESPKPEQEQVEVKKTPIIKNLSFGGIKDRYMLRDGDEIYGSLDGSVNVVHKPLSERFEYLEDAMEAFYNEIEESGIVEKADRYIAAWAKQNGIPDDPEFNDAAKEDYIREREAFRIFRQHMWEKHHT